MSKRAREETKEAPVTPKKRSKAIDAEGAAAMLPASWCIPSSPCARLRQDQRVVFLNESDPEGAGLGRPRFHVLHVELQHIPLDVQRTVVLLHQGVLNDISYRDVVPMDTFIGSWLYWHTPAEKRWSFDGGDDEELRQYLVKTSDVHLEFSTLFTSRDDCTNETKECVAYINESLAEIRGRLEQQVDGQWRSYFGDCFIHVPQPELLAAVKRESFM